ncbi:hypothetical protein [Actinoplanes sp. NPDC026670]
MDGPGEAGCGAPARSEAATEVSIGAVTVAFHAGCATTGSE